MQIEQEVHAMMITKENLSDAVYENENAKLLIEDVVENTGVCIYYSHDSEITVAMALDIWYKIYDDRKRRELRRVLPRVHRRYKLLSGGMIRR